MPFFPHFFHTGSKSGEETVGGSMIYRGEGISSQIRTEY